jgi:hypothetical protein
MNKHLIKLSEELATKDLSNHLDFYRRRLPDMYKRESSEENKQRYFKDSQGYYLNQFKQILKAMKTGRFYAGVESVSRSGMSRKIKLGYIIRNKLFHIRNPFILKLAGVDKNGRINGCGMDMLFHAQYNLFHALHKSYKQAKYQTRMKTYNAL